MLTDRQREVLALKEQGLSNVKIGKQLGVSEKTVRGHLKAARKHLNASEGQKAAMEVSGLTADVAKFGWRIIQHDDGSKDSVFWDAREAHDPEAIEDRIAEKFANIPAAPVVIRPKQTTSEIRALYPLFDVHMALQIGDYGLEACKDRVTEGMESLISRTDPAEVAIILNGGDFTHQNDASNQTPSSKHPLDVDGSYGDTIDAAVEVTVALIEMALQRHERVLYKPLAGNHDPATALMLRAALGQRYRNTHRVEIDKTGVIFFAHEWGENLIFGHHGNIRGMQIKDLMMRFAAAEAVAWGRTKHREAWTGHTHHLKSQEFPGVTWYQARAVSPASRHDIDSGYHSKAEMLSVTYHEKAGRIAVANRVF